ncbi:MAG: hypothetical protein JWQ94_3640, partial [Tardiphaga sp.]|nr:hypothetical protein [Tardiphaga sp.]
KFLDDDSKLAPVDSKPKMADPAQQSQAEQPRQGKVAQYTPSVN